ncbi:hypothetical protein F2Q70_00016461 [Brassica cretica]|uniref:Uncharacterized protein n=1 Tax=Brassica cretica TaxID=69181 RepID=A0A8S9KWE3_BRACR|nr:hypothetical protein F2Q70_00016461 [Brassica cretica]KAF2597476.1 hypothetical protein F2Q68_00009425 [Brassica cretica]
MITLVLHIVEPDHQENLELNDRTRAGTSWNASWNELEWTSTVAEHEGASEIGSTNHLR